MADSEIPLPPPTFEFLVFSLKMQAEMRLGLLKLGEGMDDEVNLPAARHTIDMLAMIAEKTKGNLHEKEQRLLDGLLGDLRMQYVHLIKATEEKLKAQAAAKFSGEDILGKK